MATDTDFVPFVADQIDPDCEVSYRNMGDHARARHHSSGVWALSHSS